MINTCFRCKSSITLSSQILLTSCSGCENSFCVNCDGLCPTVTKFINKQHDGVSWNCVDCRIRDSRSNISSKLDSIISDMASLNNSKTQSQSSNSLSFADIIKSSLKEDRQEQIINQKDVSLRLNNHIIHCVNPDLHASKYVEELFVSYLNSDVEPVLIKRIGKESILIRITYKIKLTKIQ